MPVGVSTHPINVYLELLLCVCVFKSDCHNTPYALCMLVYIDMTAYAMICNTYIICMLCFVGVSVTPILYCML